MKRIPLQVPIKNFRGEALQEGPDSGPLLLADLLCNLLGSMKATDGKEAIRIFAVGAKIYTARTAPSLELEDADLELVKKAVDVNAPGYAALVIGQVAQALDRAYVDPIADNGVARVARAGSASE